MPNKKLTVIVTFKENATSEEIKLIQDVIEKSILDSCRFPMLFIEDITNTLS